MTKARKPLDIKIGAAIKAARLQRGLTGREVAAQLKTSIGAIGNWERGANIPAAGNLFALAEYLRIDSKALARGEVVALEPRSLVPSFDPDADGEEFDPDAEVPIVGYVGAGDAAHYYAVSQGDLERVQAPKDTTKETVALEIRGESLGPAFNRWIVYYDDAGEGVRPEYVGRLCVVGLLDDRILVKVIRRSKQRGLFDLESNNPTEKVIEGVEISWAALVTDMKRRS